MLPSDWALKPKENLSGGWGKVLDGKRVFFSPTYSVAQKEPNPPGGSKENPHPPTGEASPE